MLEQSLVGVEIWEVVVVCVCPGKAYSIMKIYGLSQFIRKVRTYQPNIISNTWSRKCRLSLTQNRRGHRRKLISIVHGHTFPFPYFLTHCKAHWYWWCAESRNVFKCTEQTPYLHLATTSNICKESHYNKYNTNCCYENENVLFMGETSTSSTLEWSLVELLGAVLPPCLVAAWSGRARLWAGRSDLLPTTRCGRLTASRASCLNSSLQSIKLLAASSCCRQCSSTGLLHDWLSRHHLDRHLWETHVTLALALNCCDVYLHVSDAL